MMYAIARELDAALKAQGVPFPVVYGPEPFASTTAARERIVVEQTLDTKRDAVLPPRGTHPNPRMLYVRQQSAIVRIFARSNVAGAAWHDHTERAEEVVDHVVAELDYVVRARKNVLTITGGGFVSLLDAKGSAVWSGSVYELDIAIDRGVFRRTWTGDAQAEVTIGVDVELVTTLNASGG